MIEQFSTDLFVPDYRPAEGPTWKLGWIPMGTGLGYWSSSRLYIYQNAAVLHRTGDNPGTWMSMTPIEIESSEVGVRAAHGHTVIMGFGMGWTAAAMAVRPEVEKVTVVELDPDVPALFDLTLPQEARPPEWDKVDVVIHDACTWTPTAPVDFMFADIWPVMGGAANLAQLRQMQSNVQATSLYYWGQELDIGDKALELGWKAIAPVGISGENAPLDEPLLQQAVAALDLPLVLAQPPAERVEGAWREWVRRMRPELMVHGTP